MTKMTTQAISRVALRSNQHGVHDIFNETALMLACVENNHQSVKLLMDIDHTRASFISASYIASKSLHPLAFGQDVLFMALNHLNFDAALQVLQRLLEITQNKRVDFESSQHVGTREIIEILETRHHIVRVSSFMLMFRHGQLKLLETTWDLLKAAEKREKKNTPFSTAFLKTMITLQMKSLSECLMAQGRSKMHKLIMSMSNSNRIVSAVVSTASGKLLSITRLDHSKNALFAGLLFTALTFVVSRRRMY